MSAIVALTDGFLSPVLDFLMAFCLASPVKSYLAAPVKRGRRPTQSLIILSVIEHLTSTPPNRSQPMLADIIPKIAAMDQDEDHPYHPRPSLASPNSPENPGRCVRAMTYHRMGVLPAPWPGRFILILNDSSWHEELTMDWLAKSSHRIHSRQMAVDYVLPTPIGSGGFCRYCQQPIPNTVLHGHIDALFTDLGSVDRLLEHKAVNRFRYEELLKGELPLDYLTQCCLYLGGLRRVAPDIREAVLLIKNKDTSAYLELNLSYDAEHDQCTLHSLIASDGTNRVINRTLDGLITSALKKFQQVEAAATANALPPRPYRRDAWNCDYCRFGKHCWEGYAQEVAVRDNGVTLHDDLAPLLAAYYDASETKADAEACTKRLRPRILAALEAAHVKTGSVDGYRAAVNVQERSQLDQSLIPADVKAAATVIQPVEILRVSTHTE